jgi:hypothetical protein
MQRFICAIVLIGTLNDHAVAQSESDGKSDPISPVPSPPGRYQIVLSPLNARDVFLLDSATGRVWQRTTLSFLIGEPDVWIIVPRLDSDDEREKFERETGFKKTK